MTFRRDDLARLLAKARARTREGQPRPLPEPPTLDEDDDPATRKAAVMAFIIRRTKARVAELETLLAAKAQPPAAPLRVAVRRPEAAWRTPTVRPSRTTVAVVEGGPDCGCTLLEEHLEHSFREVV